MYAYIEVELYSSGQFLFSSRMVLIRTVPGSEGGRAARRGVTSDGVSSSRMHSRSSERDFSRSGRATDGTDAGGHDSGSSRSNRSHQCASEPIHVP